MEITLRPLTLGEILDRTVAIYRKNFWLLAGISSVYAAIALLIGVVNILIDHWAQHHISASSFLIFLQLSASILTIIILVLNAIPIAAVNRVIASLNLGKTVTIRSAYQTVLRRAGSYLWLMTLLVLMIYGPYAILTSVYMGVFSSLGIHLGDPNAAAHMSSNPASLIAIGILGLAALILFPALIAYMIWMMLRCALSIPASVVEGLSARAAIRRSIELTREARGRIFVLYLLVFVIRIGLLLLFDGPLLVLVFKQAMHNPMNMNMGLEIAQQFMVFLVTAFITPIYSTGFMLFYYDQRVRKEGFDIERMMQIAGLHEAIETTSQDPIDRVSTQVQDAFTPPIAETHE